jgi:hypothetical protein
LPAVKRSSPIKQILLLAALLAILVVVLGASSTGDLEAYTGGAVNSTGSAESATASGLANCRYGVTISEHGESMEVISNVGAGVYYRFNSPYYKRVPANDAERLLMIRVKQRKDSGVYLPDYWTEVPLDQELADFIRDNPGYLWMLGNEIERGPDPDRNGTSQGDIFPDMYARAYHDIYHFIKGIDPTARIAIAGLIQATPSRLQYLDNLWTAYQEIYGVEMPVDVWNIHLYILPEVTPEGEPNGIANIALGTDKALGKRESGRDASLCPDPDVYCYAEHDDVSIIAEQMVAIRRWMKERGQQNKPLIVSEFSTLFHIRYDEDGKCMGLRDENGECFTPERVSQYLQDSFNHLNTARDDDLGYPLDGGRLVQQWIWYDSAWEYTTGRLLEPDTSELSPTGQAFRDHVFAEQPVVNLIAEKATAETTRNAGGNYDARLTVNFRNNGNVATNEPILVSFYRDEGLSQLIGSTAVSATVRGCATASYTAAVDWPDLAEGTYQFWVEVDSLNTIREPAEWDNTAAGSVNADPTSQGYSLDIQIDTVVPGQGGSVSKSPDAIKYGAGQSVELTAVPYTGWKFESWSGDVSGTDPTAHVTIDGNKTVRAKFVPIPYQVNMAISGNGSVLVSPRKDSYIYGETISFQAVPVLGWRFTGWSGAVQEARPTVEIKLNEDVDLAANFAQILPTVTDQVYLPLNAAEEK